MLARRLLTLVLPALIFSSSSYAMKIFISGNNLYPFAQAYHRYDTDPNNYPQDLATYSYFLAYVTGVADTLASAGTVCTPASATPGQLSDIVYMYLSQHPDERQYTATSTIGAALLTAFPKDKC